MDIFFVCEFTEHLTPARLRQALAFLWGGWLRIAIPFDLTLLRPGRAHSEQQDQKLSICGARRLQPAG